MNDIYTFSHIKSLNKYFGSAKKTMEESGVPNGTFYNMQKSPDTVCNGPNADLIRRCYSKHITSEWDLVDAPIKSILFDIDSFHLELNTRTYKQVLNRIKSSLSRDKDLNMDTIEGAGIDFCLAKVGFIQRFTLKDPNAFTLQECDKYLELALTKLYKFYPDKFQITISKIIQTRFAIFFMGLKENERINSEVVHQRILNDNYLELSKKVLKKENWHWETARNALVVASILKNKEECVYFWEALKGSHKCFINPNFTPKTMPSILKDVDLVWFRTNILFTYMETSSL